MPSVKMRASYNDLWSFDTQIEQWNQLEPKGLAPKKRMNHVTCRLGCIMLTHGGFSTEGKIMLDDFNLYDIELQRWLNVVVTMNGHEVKSDAQYGADQAIDDGSSHIMTQVGARQNHCAAAVYDQDYYNHKYKKAGRETRGRVMWSKERVFSHEEHAKQKSYHEGIYIFGGMNNKGHILNDLWLVQPLHSSNKRVMSSYNHEYSGVSKEDPTLSLNIVKISDYSGQPPCPRINAQMIHLNIKHSGHQLVVVYGGRNDKIFNSTGNVALNDIAVFNCNLLSWEPLAMFGQMPCSRWSHTMIALSSTQSYHEGLLIFGGVNLNAYCRSNFYTFSFSHKKVTESNQLNDMLASSQVLSTDPQSGHSRAKTTPKRNETTATKENSSRAKQQATATVTSP